jgi:GT2 family glycosyltransferase
MSVPIRISVVIPTWNRVDYLQRAFQGLATQNRPVDEVVVGVRKEDASTLDWLSTQTILTGDLVRAAHVEVPGVVASMQAGLRLSTGDVVCLLDDDAVPYPDWLLRLEKGFDAHPGLGGLGGRDILAYLTEAQRSEGLQPIVGRYAWYGKFFANHHCGKGPFRQVHVLKGCNCAFRGDLIRKVGFDEALAGWDTQTHWETALCLDITAQGFKVAYDPAIQVLHYVAPRHGPDQNYRGGYSEEGIYHQAHNEAYVLHTRWGGSIRLRTIDLFGLVCGTKQTPGLLQWLRLRLRRDPTANSRFRATLRGRRDGLRLAKRRCL